MLRHVIPGTRVPAWAVIAFTSAVVLTLVAPVVWADDCGNGSVEGTEQCDDGNTLDGDCCASTCIFEPDGSPCPDAPSECTYGQCNAHGGCVRTPNHGICDDGIFCNGAEECDDDSGDCMAAAPIDCEVPDDCGRNEYCDEVLDRCVSTPSDAECDDGSECSVDTCDPTTLLCVHVPDDSRCDDDNPCTDDTCALDFCVYSPNDANACTDSIACTTDTCVGGACVATPNDAACDDGLFCTGVESCVSGIGCTAEDPCPGQLCDETNNICMPLPTTTSTTTTTLPTQVFDHLKCYRVKDPLKLKGVVDLTPTQESPFDVEEGCKIAKAKKYCIPVMKDVDESATNVPVVPFPGQPLVDDYICYKVRCPEVDITRDIVDQFGTRRLEKFKARELCVPAAQLP